MKTPLFIVILCFISINAFSRIVVTGNIYEKETNTPVETAIVNLLLLPDSTIIETFYTTTEGLYTLTKADTTKTYCLKVSKSFLKTKFVPVVFNSPGRILSLGKTELEPSTFNLKELVVNGSKIQVKELADRTIYGISTDMKKTSTDGLDILRKVPTVQVDYFNEDIKVEGKSNIVIEVDGITRDKNYLKKLHPSQVDKMEVITNPTGKYDADVDAVINIITIREMRYGLKGNVNAALFPNSLDAYMFRGSAGLDYGLKKISYYVAANGGVGKFDFVNTMLRNSGTNSVLRDGLTKSNFNNTSYSGGLIFDPNEFDNLSVNLSYTNNNSKNQNDLFSIISDNTLFTSKNGSSTNSTNENGGINSSLFYKHKFDKKDKQSYEVEATYYNSLRNKSVSNYQYSFYDEFDNELSISPLQFEENNTNSNSFNTRGNYNLKFDSIYTFNSGINGNYSYNFIENHKSGGATVPDLEYVNMKGSLFAEFGMLLKKGNFKVGTRYELSGVTINTTNKNTYSSPLPYANGQYKFNDKNSLKLNYSRRVFRPSNGQLNPFVSYIDSLTESHGNIDLKPAYRDNFQLTHSLKYGKNKFSGNISPQLFFEYRSGLIQTITQQKAGTNIFEKYPVNVSNGYETGLNLSIYAQIAVVIFNSNIRYSKIHTDNYLDQIVAIDRDSWSWSSQLMCPLPKEFRVFAMVNINGPSVNGQEISQSAPFYLMGLSKQFKNNSSLTIIALNPFATKSFYSSSTINNSYLYQKSENYMNVKNAVMINYTINFKVGKDINLNKQNQQQGLEDGSFKLPF